MSARTYGQQLCSVCGKRVGTNNWKQHLRSKVHAEAFARAVNPSHSR